MIDATDYFSSGETVFVFLKNVTTVASKFIYVKIGSQVIAKIKPGGYALIPWYVADGSTDLLVYSNDATTGVKVEYFAVKETT